MYKKNWFKTVFTVLAAISLLLPYAAINVSAEQETAPQLHMLQYIAGEKDENGNYVQPYYVDENGRRIDEINVGQQSSQTKELIHRLPDAYDSRSYGRVTPVKSQASAGSCWAFAATSAMESSMITHGYSTPTDTDFSEAHLVWFTHRSLVNDPNDGTYGDGYNHPDPFASDAGTYEMAAASTYFRGSGPQLEANAPWLNIDDYTINPQMIANMQNAEATRYDSYARLWKVEQTKDVYTAKRWIMGEGAVQACLWIDSNHISNHINLQTGAYYQQISSYNHAVSIVGWDDNYSRNNFNSSCRPQGNGAWLVKNSWGHWWGTDGYLWLSYEDPSCTYFYRWVAAPKNTYDHIYQYDGVTANHALGYGKTVSYAANRFTAERDELLTHVAARNDCVGAAIKAEVYTAPVGYTPGNDSPLDGMQRVESAKTWLSDVGFGYHTISLNDPVILKKGQKFTVVVTYISNNGESVYLPVEGDHSDFFSYRSHIGESYIGTNGFWHDTSVLEYNNVPIKAMTKEVPFQTPTLTVETMPTRTTYMVGETLDATGLTLCYTDEIGRTSVISSGMTCTPTALNAIGTQTVTVGWNGLYTAFDVTVQPYEPLFAVYQPPYKTEYMVGELLDTTGLKCVYRNEYGQHSFFDIAASSCYPSILFAAGEQTVSVRWNGMSAAFTVTVQPYPNRLLTLLRPPTKTTYMVGETLDTTGLECVYRDENSRYIRVSTELVCSPTVLNTVGKQTVIVSYQGLFTTFNVTVQPYTPQLTVVSPPQKTSYAVGETLNTTGLVLQYTDIYNTQMLVDTGYTCDTDVLRTPGTHTVTVSYAGLTTAFDVQVSYRTDPDDPLTPRIQIQGGSAKAGGTVDVTVLLSHDPGIASTLIRLTYDTDVLTLIGVQNGDVFADGAMTAGETFASPYPVYWKDTNRVAAGDDSGTLVTYTFRVRQDAPAGSTTVTAEYDSTQTIDAQGFAVPFLTENRAQPITVFLSGDVNDDGERNLLDVVLLTRYFAGCETTSAIDVCKADINGDGKVNLKDTVLLRRFLAGWNVTLY